MLDLTTAQRHIDRQWDDIVPVLCDYIRIPNKSPAFDAEWKAHGHMDRAVDLIVDWCRRRAIADLRVEVHQLPGRTPVVLCEVPAFGGGPASDTVLLYGHLDKQPEFSGWRTGLGPWEPVIEGERLYGRGGGDDGYAVFAALTAIEAVQAAGGTHARCVVLIEASEESGSSDLEAHIERLAPRLGSPGLVICLDSSCADYDRLWLTTSLRGIIVGDLEVAVLSGGVHSGSASGAVPSTFRIARSLLSRIEDEATGRMLLPELHVDIPPQRVADARALAEHAPHALCEPFPLLDGVRLVADDPVEMALGHTWRPALSVTGAAGLPALSDAGNVLRPATTLHLSIRIPPGADPHRAADALARALTSDPPYGAHVRFANVTVAAGWSAPVNAAWLAAAVDRASRELFGLSAGAVGEGGSIPFMAMLGARFPDAQFVVTGVLGPHSNAHGPDEYLHLPTARRVSGAVACLLDAHAVR